MDYNSSIDAHHNESKQTWKAMQILRTLLALALVSVAATSCTKQHVAFDSSVSKTVTDRAAETVLASEVEWAPLNPARGDKGPKAGALWGDQTGSGASGFLVKFVDGFSSPPHIHNITYRGMVISGLIHNDDPGAEPMWMPTGSFWTQPAGEPHITAAKGSRCVAYIEIENGPYLVLPTQEAFDNGERPINVDSSNIVWVDQPGVAASASGPKIAFLWGNPQGNHLSGSLVKLPAEFVGTIRGIGSAFRAVIIRGEIEHQTSGEFDARLLEPGSCFGSQSESVHQVSCEAESECIIYMRTKGKFEVTATQPKY
ncbi:MAG: hypothetical protein DHS20C16_32850 [Phycisphaerae bacterium]|nr:MAG: hypothetical protein DHS20C16_32850 [Phycisphaerae bacterium]